MDTLTAATHQDTESAAPGERSRRTSEATPPDNPAIDSEVRERLELRAKTGIGDFLAAAVGGAAVSGAAAEYCESLGVPVVGHLPMAIFDRPAPTVETRAITAGASRRRECCSPSYRMFLKAIGSGQPRYLHAVRPNPARSRYLGNRPQRRQADTLAKDASGSGDGCGGHAGESGSRPHRGPVSRSGWKTWP